MNKILKTLLSLAVMIVIIATMFTFSASAAGDTVISFSTKNVNVGDTVSVTVTVSEKKMYGANISIQYDEKILKYVSGAEGGGGEVRIVKELSGESKKSFTVTFKAAKAGSCVISASGSVGAGIPSTDVNIAGASATMTVKDVTLSANANLKSLSVSAGSISPRFSQSKTYYTVNVKKSVTSCKIYAETADSDAKVSVSGNSTLKIGENKRTVTVTAPSGAQKVYTVVINRSDIDEETVSSAESTTSESEEENPLDVVIDGMPYKVISNIKKIDLPKGFKVAKRLFNGKDVTVAVDGENIYELFYLKPANGENVVAYQYNEDENSFERVFIIQQGEKQYIMANLPEGYAIPEGYYETNANIQDMAVKCYASADIADMYYVYCYYGGKSGMYRYDSIEDVLQRSPELHLVKAGAKTDKKSQSGNILSRFNALSTNGKTVIVCLVLGFLGIIALIVLLIIKFFRSGKPKNSDDEDEQFNAIKLNENFEIVSDNKK